MTDESKSPTPVSIVGGSLTPISAAAQWVNPDGDPIPGMSPIKVTVVNADIRSLIEPRNVDGKAEALARQIWGYFKGDSTGGTTAMQWFDNNKLMGGPAHIINLCRAALSATATEGE